jgi:hypothetical protein
MAICCAGSVHMRRRGRRAEAAEILGWSEIAKGLVGSVVVVAMGEGFDERLEFVDTIEQVVGGVKIVAPAGLGALDAAVEIGPLGRQDDEFEAVMAAMVFVRGPTGKGGNGSDMTRSLCRPGTAEICAQRTARVDVLRTSQIAIANGTNGQV